MSKPDEPEAPQPSLRLGRHSVRLPGSKASRTVLGGALVAGGVFSFLPVLGLWMLPLGVLTLSVDHHPIRRQRRKAEVWWGRRRQRKAEKSQP
ncbi:MAG TPA: phage holin family protein [Rhizomicrobium sp.]|nr:phage holin family protein [Rhizomicrobium sp.]